MRAVRWHRVITVCWVFPLFSLMSLWNNLWLGLDWLIFQSFGGSRSCGPFLWCHYLGREPQICFMVWRIRACLSQPWHCGNPARAIHCPKEGPEVGMADDAHTHAEPYAACRSQDY